MKIDDVDALVEIGRVVVERRAAQLERVEVALRQRVPLDLVHATLAPDFDASAPAVVEARRWVDAGNRGLLCLAGRVGTGKSLGLAVWAIATGALWVNAAEVSTWQLDAAEKTRRWSDAPALAIDELGGQGSTGDREVARLAVVLAARWGAGRPTAISTNLSRVTVARLFDDARPEESRLMDRIRERGAWAQIGGESRRGAPADVVAGQQRLERWRRIAKLVDRLSSAVARLEDDAHVHVHALAKLLGVTKAQLEQARAALDKRADHNAAKADALLEQWRTEAEIARAAAEAAGEDPPTPIAGHVGGAIAGLVRRGAGAA